MRHIGLIGSYDRFYSDLNFDRAGLFQAISDEYRCGTVLYPRCSIYKKGMSKSSSGMEYEDNECYFAFRKIYDEA